MEAPSQSEVYDNAYISASNLYQTVRHEIDHQRQQASEMKSMFFPTLGELSDLVVSPGVVANGYSALREFCVSIMDIQNREFYGMSKRLFLAKEST
jgi:hypothetical protein